MGINASRDVNDSFEPISSIPIKPTGTRYGTRTTGNVEDIKSSLSGSLTGAGVTSIDEDTGDLVPTVFRWEHGGRNVFLTGTFNNWERQIPMHKSGNDFTYVHNLKRGKHAFKFIVDDEWRFAPDQPTIADVEGHINNFIDVSEFIPYVGDDKFFDKSKGKRLPSIQIFAHWFILLIFKKNYRKEDP